MGVGVAEEEEVGIGGGRREETMQPELRRVRLEAPDLQKPGAAVVFLDTVPEERIRMGAHSSDVAYAPDARHGLHAALGDLHSPLAEVRAFLACAGLLFRLLKQHLSQSRAQTGDHSGRLDKGRRVLLQHLLEGRKGGEDEQHAE